MIDNMKVVVLIAAAGMSNRMKSDINKTFLLIDGKPILSHTINKFEKVNMLTDSYRTCT